MFSKEINWGEQTPWYMGFVYTQWERDTSIFCLIPFNWLWSFSREVLYFLKKGRKESLVKEAQGDAFKNGYEIAKRIYGKKEK